MTFWFLILLVTQICCSVWFHAKQNQDKFTGGPISWPKALWLFHAIFSWYLVPIVYLFIPDLHIVLKSIIFIHTLVWWIRGPIELVMIYKTFNWSPRYGIAHDSLHLFFIFVATVVTCKMWEPSLINWLAFSYLCVTVIMTTFELWFAALFLQVRGHSDHKIYYAANEPKWRFINRLTTAALVIGLGHALLQAVLAL